jgi:hypothetical protein
LLVASVIEDALQPHSREQEVESYDAALRAAVSVNSIELQSCVTTFPSPHSEEPEFTFATMAVLMLIWLATIVTATFTEFWCTGFVVKDNSTSAVVTASQASQQRVAQTL